SWPVCAKLAGARQLIFDTHRTTSADATKSGLSASVALRPCRKGQPSGRSRGGCQVSVQLGAIRCNRRGERFAHHLHTNYTQLSTTRKVLTERLTEPVPSGAVVRFCHKSKADKHACPTRVVTRGGPQGWHRQRDADRTRRGRNEPGAPSVAP